MSKVFIHQQTWQEVDNILKKRNSASTNMTLRMFVQNDESLLLRVISACRETRSIRDHLASSISGNNSLHFLVLSGDTRSFSKDNARIAFSSGTRIPSNYLPPVIQSEDSMEEGDTTSDSFCENECIGFYDEEVLQLNSGLLEVLLDKKCLTIGTTVQIFNSINATYIDKDDRPFNISSSECTGSFSSQHGGLSCQACAKAKKLVREKYSEALRNKKNIESDNSRDFLRGCDVNHTQIRNLTRDLVNRLVWNLIEQTRQYWSQRNMTTDALTIDVDMNEDEYDNDDGEDDDGDDESDDDDDDSYRCSMSENNTSDGTSGGLSSNKNSITNSTRHSKGSPSMSVLSPEILSPTLQKGRSSFEESSASIIGNSAPVNTQSKPGKRTHLRQSIVKEFKSDVLFSCRGYQSRNEQALIPVSIKGLETPPLASISSDTISSASSDPSGTREQLFATVLESAKEFVEKVGADLPSSDFEESKEKKGDESISTNSSNGSKSIKDPREAKSIERMPQTGQQVQNLFLPPSQRTEIIKQAVKPENVTVNTITGMVETLTDVLDNFEDQARYLNSVIHDFKQDERYSNQIIVRIAVMSDLLKRTSQDLRGKHLRSKLHPETIIECIDMAVMMGLNKYEKAFRGNFPLLGKTEIRKAFLTQKSNDSGNRFNAIKANNALRDTIMLQLSASGKKDISQVLACYDVKLMFDEKKLTPKMSIDHRLGTVVGVAQKSLQQSYQIATGNSEILEESLATHTCAWYSVPTQSGSDDPNNEASILAYQSGSFLTGATTASDMLSQFDQQETAHLAGGNVVTMIMSDRGTPNAKMMEALVKFRAQCIDPRDTQAHDGVTLVYFTSMMNALHRTYCLYDPCHAIPKGLRNNIFYSREQSEGGTKHLLLKDPISEELVHVDWSKHVVTPFNQMNGASGHLVFERGLNKTMITATDTSLGKMKVGDAAAFHSKKHVRLQQRWIQWVKDGRVTQMGSVGVPPTLTDAEDFKAINAMNVIQNAANDMFDVTNGKDMEKCNRQGGHFVYKEMIDYTNKSQLSTLRHLPRILKQSVRDVESEIERQETAGFQNPPTLFHSTLTYQTIGAVSVLGFGLADYVEWYTKVFRKGTKCRLSDDTTDVCEIHFGVIGARANGPLTAANVPTLESKSTTKRLIRAQEYVARGCVKSKTRDQSRDMMQPKKGNTTFVNEALSNTQMDINEDDDDDSSYTPESDRSSTSSDDSDCDFHIDNAECAELTESSKKSFVPRADYKFSLHLKRRTKVRKQSHLLKANETVSRFTSSELCTMKGTRKKEEASITSSSSRKEASKKKRSNT